MITAPGLKEIIRYYVDKGISRKKLMEQIQEETKYDIDEMLSDQILTTGSAYGHDDWLVVTECMPKTAQSLRGQN